MFDPADATRFGTQSCPLHATSKGNRTIDVDQAARADAKEADRRALRAMFGKLNQVHIVALSK
jgi:hypothetical protein